MELANASLLDEATAAAEAMAMARRVSKSKSARFFVDADCHPQTIAVVRTRAAPLGIDVVAGDPYEAFGRDAFDGDVFGVLVQYPGSSGALRDPSAIVERVQAAKGLAIFAADLLALCLVEPPGAFGADVVVGSAQRFGVPMGFGGPHAAFFATAMRTSARPRGGSSASRWMRGPAGVAHGVADPRAAHPAREGDLQHLHRPSAARGDGGDVRRVPRAGAAARHRGRVHRLAKALAAGLAAAGREVVTGSYFDTITVRVPGEAAALAARARDAGFNVRLADGDHIGLSLDETIRVEDVRGIIAALSTGAGVGGGETGMLHSGAGGEDSGVPAVDAGGGDPEVPGADAGSGNIGGPGAGAGAAGGSSADVEALAAAAPDVIGALARKSPYLTHPVFHAHHSETEMLRYLRRLAAKDLALDRSMIPLGSCTMKLNATAEMIPVTFPGFAALHPFVPADQALGYRELCAGLNGCCARSPASTRCRFSPTRARRGSTRGCSASAGITGRERREGATSA